MSRIEINKCIKTNMVSFSWHASERMRERRINKMVLIQALMYGLLRKDANDKTVVSYRNINVVIAANSIGIVICTVY